MQNECWGIILAAGQGRRMAEATGGEAKQFLRWKGVPLWWHSALAMAASPLVHGLVFVFPPDRKAEAEEELCQLDRTHPLGVRIAVTEGGSRRQDSVRHGLRTLPERCGLVLVHDSARPFLSTALTTRLAKTLNERLSDGIMGVIPGLAVTDTIKQVDASAHVTSTPARAQLRAVQTPQAFPAEALSEAHDRALNEDWDVTDDASLMEQCGLPVLVIEGDAANIKITNPQDLAMLNESKPLFPCCGYGYDVHAYGGDRPLMLGGVHIGGDFLVRAHSDGDVLLHALMDAILGCLAAGDIGHLFPDNDSKFDNISSVVLLDHVMNLAAEAGLRLCHVDLTVIAQKPKLAPHADAIRRNVARLLDLPLEHVAFKATTEEKLGFTGELKGLKAVALVSAVRQSTA